MADERLPDDPEILAEEPIAQSVLPPIVHWCDELATVRKGERHLHFCSTRTESGAITTQHATK
jgi:hypothetical protein